MLETDNLFEQRRRYFRHSTAIPITIFQTEQDVTNLQILNDISSGGLCFVSEQAWETGTVLTINFNSPADMQEELLTLYGQVMWCRQAAADYFDVGLQFIQPAEMVIEVVSTIEAWYAKDSLAPPLAEQPSDTPVKQHTEARLPLLLTYQTTV